VLQSAKAKGLIALEATVNKTAMLNISAQRFPPFLSDGSMLPSDGDVGPQ
jgi:hypothetical protein